MSSPTTPARPPRVHTRLESAGGGERRFWEITVVGAVVSTRHGAVGTDGQVSGPRVLPDHALALAEAERQIEDRRQSGFEPVDPLVGTHAFAPELFAALLDAEDDDETALLVYADWLQAQGDVRGELAMLQHGLARRAHDARMHRAERQLHKEHGARLLPARVAEMLRLRDPRLLESGTCQLDWRLGFVHRARIGRSQMSPPYTVRELVIALLDHPSGQLVRELVIGALGPGRTYDYRSYDYQPVVTALCEIAPAALRTLVLAEFEPEHVELADSHLGDVSGLLRSLPRLRDLRLRGGTLELGELCGPGLQRFCLRPAALTPEHLAAMNTARWPALTELAVDAGAASVDMGALSALLSAERVPALRTLRLTHTLATSDIWRALASSPLLGQLEVLELSHGDLGDGDIAAMLSQAAAFSHLRQLVLDGNYISRPHRPEVRALCAEVSLSEQRGAAADLPRISPDDIIELAPDVRSYMAAGDVAEPSKWPQLGSWMTVVWGRYQGTALYDVFVDLSTMEAGCTCPSAKYPCKHALALLMLSTHGRLVPVLEPPPGLLDACRASRYDDLLE